MVEYNGNIELSILEEIKSVNKCQKMNNVSSIYDIPAEFIKSGPWSMNAIHNLVLSIWNQKQISQRCDTPNPQKSNKLTCENYRDTPLLCTSCKIFIFNITKEN